MTIKELRKEARKQNMKKFLIISLIVLIIASAGAVVAMKVLNNKHEHTYGEWETKTPATCTEAEVEVRRCECNEEETREGDAPLGHKYTSVVTAPTCTEAGYTTYTCTCGDSYKDDEVAATGHSFVNEVAEEKYLATNNCGEQPTYFKSCSCGEKGSETFAYGEVNGHVYSSVITAPTCTEGGYTTYTCTCGDSYVGDETESLDHNMVTVYDDTHHWTECDREGCDEATEKVAHSVASISALCNIENPMDTMVVKAKDLTVTANCDCGHSFAVTEGIELENATLALGENTLTVKYGELSTALIITAAELDVALNGAITDNTYVSSANSSSKDKDNSSATELKAYSNNFRVYFRVNIKDAINNELFNASKAKVQLTLTIINEGTNQNNLTFNGEIADKVYTLKAYTDTGVAFSDITWNNVDGTDLHWGSGKGLVSNEAGSNITVADGKITITVAYSHLADCVDENGNIILAFASQNAKSISVGSISNEGMEPAVKVLLNEDTVHVFDQENADEKYFASAKCTEQAKYYKSCSCGEMCFVTFNYGDVIDHEFGDWTTTKEATCTEAGKETRACANCIKTETQTIDALGHSYNAVVTQPTCTEKGYTTYTCGVCGDSYVADEVVANGHSYGDWQQTTAPTCTAEGEETKYCANCDSTETQSVAMLSHSYNAVVTQPTCTEKGYTTYTCGGCGDSYVADEVAANGHSGGTATETEQATCDICGEKYGGVASHQHSYSSVVTEPTCTADGYTTYTCSGCGDSYADIYVDARGHTEEEIPAVAPTCTNTGLTAGVKCSVCNEVLTAQTDIDALGHTEGETVVENSKDADCTNDGSYDNVIYCTECGYELSRETVTVAATGHKYTDAADLECDVCGYTKTEVTVAGTIKDDTYVSSDSKSADNSGKTDLNVRTKPNSTSTNYWRSYFRFNFSDVLKAEGFAADKDNAKVTFTFAVTSGTIADDTTFTFYAFNVDEATDAVAFSAINWTSVKDGDYAQLGFNNGCATSLVGDNNITYANGLLTITVNYSDIEGCMDANGNCIFGLTTSSTDLKVGSMENEGNSPAVSVTYTK